MTCSIDGCEKPRRTRGWCNAHYERWRKHGDVGEAALKPFGVEGCKVEDCDRPHRFITVREKRMTRHEDDQAPDLRKRPSTVEQCSDLRFFRPSPAPDIHVLVSSLSPQHLEGP